ncbi:MAG: hypothetical protein ABSA86_06250 [Oryzomonas sp.]
MNITRKIGLALLLVALGAPSAFAALSGDAAGNAEGIELSDDDAQAQHHIDQMLAVKVLDETTLQRHARSALRAPAPMEGHYGREGAETPELFGKQELSQFAPRHAASEGAGESAGLAQMTAVHEVGNGAVTGEAPVISAGISSAATSYVVNSPGGGQTSVPLPPALLLMASGLLCLPTIRQRIKLSC